MNSSEKIISFEEFLEQNAGKIPLVYKCLIKKSVEEERNYFINKNREVSSLYNSSGYLKGSVPFPICKFDIFND